MKNIEEIKNEVAVKHGYVDFKHIKGCILLGKIDPSFVEYILNEIAEEYAKQCCQTQIVNCTINLNVDYPKGTEKYSDAVNSILNTPNVVTTK